MGHFKRDTCESCQHYRGEYFMDGPAICAVHKILIWPGNKKCHDYLLSLIIGRAYSRTDWPPGDCFSLKITIFVAGCTGNGPKRRFKGISATG